MGVPPPGLEDTAHQILGQLNAPVPSIEGIEFHPLERATPPSAAAVDGGQSVVADLGSGGIAAVRAGFCVRGDDGSYDDRPGMELVRFVPKSSADQAWREVVRAHDWGVDLDPPPAKSQQWLRAWCEAVRSFAEFDAARRALRLLREGDLLLLDGSLDGEGAYPQLTDALLQAARRERIHVAAVSKDTSLSLGGTLPFTLEVEEVARKRSAPPAFAADVGQRLGRSGLFRTYAVRFDAVCPVYRVDVAAETEPLRVLERLAALADDVGYPGYPYPLARVHRRVHFADHEAGDLKRRLEAIVAERRGSLFSMRLFGRGRDVLALGE